MLIFGTSDEFEIMAKPPKEILLEQERFELKPKSGGGILRHDIWGDRYNVIAMVPHHNLARINHFICHVDNGRVMGFDNAHAYHHRHYMGEVTAVEFTSYEVTLERFQQEWLEIVAAIKGKK